ncbi:sulfite exporter TauE/SafE family protein [Kineococcus sp. SYSU DK003]|uniref:sulfite exporter TauE/SafE family protein n=1 Tax=Kineococcus sp. SYSU DK003 TaxID=3383124 RepID=UPI003D7EE508
MLDLTTTQLIPLYLAALVIGFSKTSIGGAGTIAVAIFAAVLPAKESTGIILPLLILGDLFAISIYRRHADWGLLVRLFPSVAVGVVAGAGFVRVVDDTVMRRSIGVLLILLVAIHLWRQHRLRKQETVVPMSSAKRQVTALGFGLLAGFTTMVANAGGAPMSIYLFTMGLGVMAFLGTGAWFFFIVNVFKVPFSIALGLISLDSLWLDLRLAPAVVVGALIGWWLARRMDQKKFEGWVLGTQVVASVNLLR